MTISANKAKTLTVGAGQHSATHHAMGPALKGSGVLFLSL